MSIQLFLDLSNLTFYGDIPETPKVQDGQVEEYTLDFDDVMYFMKDIDSLNSACSSLLDLGDVDFFDAKKCILLKGWITEKLTRNTAPRYREILETLFDYCNRAITLDTGVVIEL